MNKENEIDYLSLYEICLNEGHVYLKSYEERISFYIGIITAIFSGIAIGSYHAFDNSEDHLILRLILLVGLVAIAMFSEFAIRGTERLYRQILENVTVRAKIEQKLNLTQKPTENTDDPDIFWETEPIIPTRHIKARLKRKSSKKFVKKGMKSGYQRTIRQFFRLIQIFCGVFAFAFLYFIFCTFL